MTNGESIRQMTDDQLADLLTKPACNKCVYHEDPRYGGCSKGNDCRQGIWQWLIRKQEG